MLRMCQPELLDHLPVDDPGAIQSRRDLRRLNAWMGNARFVAGALNSFLPEGRKKILEIGAGDGSFFMQVAKRLSGGGKVVLLDRQDLIKAESHKRFEELGWEAEAVCEDVFGYLSRNQTRQRDEAYPFDAVIANLFLHHFSDGQLAQIFGQIAQKGPILVATEPRRSLFSVFLGKLVWAIGCNSVTRHDVRISIRAGFTGRELSELWPETQGWICEERFAGFSTQLFVARRPMRSPSAAQEIRASPRSFA